MNHSFTFLRLACCTHASPTTIRSTRSLSTRTPTRSEPCPLPHFTRKVPPKGEWTSPGRSRDVQRHRERTVHRPVSRMAASQHSFTSDVLSNHCQMAPSLRTPHYTTGCFLSPHATSHTMIVLSEAAGRFRGGRARCSSRLPRRPGRGCSLGRMSHYTTGCSQSYHRLLSSAIMCPQRHKALWL